MSTNPFRKRRTKTGRRRTLPLNPLQQKRKNNFDKLFAAIPDHKVHLLKLASDLLDMGVDVDNIITALQSGDDVNSEEGYFDWINKQQGMLSIPNTLRRKTQKRPPPPSRPPPPRTPARTPRQPRPTQASRLVPRHRVAYRPLPIIGAKNGPNGCWINAPMYAFVALQPVMDLYRIFSDYCPPQFTRSSQPRFDDFREEVFTLLTKAREQPQFWNGELYKIIYDILLPRINWTGVGWGQYGNAFAVVNEFLNVILNNCDYFKAPIKVHSFMAGTQIEFNHNVSVVEAIKYDAAAIFHNGPPNPQEYELIALIKGVNCVEPPEARSYDQSRALGHFVSFVKIQGNDWILFDAVHGETQRYNYRNIWRYGGPCTDGEVQQYIGIYFSRTEKARLEALIRSRRTGGRRICHLNGKNKRKTPTLKSRKRRKAIKQGGNSFKRKYRKVSVKSRTKRTKRTKRGRRTKKHRH